MKQKARKRGDSARKRGISDEQVHARNVNAHHSRLRNGFNHFHGVATKFLPHDLGQSRAIEARRLNTPELLLRATIGIFPVGDNRLLHLRLQIVL